MKLRKISAILLAISTALTPMALASCADIHAAADSLLKKVGATDTVSTGSSRQPNSEQYTVAAEAWVALLSDYAHETYHAGDSVKDINILYLGYMFCNANAKELGSVILTNPDGAPSYTSMSGAELERICRNLIASDFSLSDYHKSMENSADTYYAGDDLYSFFNNRDYWLGDNYSVSDSTATTLSNGNIAVNACVYHWPSIGLAENFRMLEYELEPIVEGKVVYFRLLGITDKGAPDENITKTGTIVFKAYQNLNDLTYSDGDGIEWDKRPTVAEAKLTVPTRWSVSGDEILVDVNREDYCGFVRCMQFELIKVGKDYTLSHDIHDLRTTEEMRKCRYSDEVAVVWRFYDDYDRGASKSASGYEYVSYFKDYVEDDGTKSRSEQRYYRVSDEYVLGVYYGADKDYLDKVLEALDNMTFEVK